MALKQGTLVVPPTGDIAVYKPVRGDDLSILPTERVVVITGFKPDHDHFSHQGYRTALTGPATLALVCVPRAKADARALIALAANTVGPTGQIVVDGQKTDGTEAVLRDIAGLGVALGEVMSKAHGKLAVIPAAAALAAWKAEPKQLADGFVTMPGVFSADGPDRGSVLLAHILPPKLPGRVADLGAGWGYLSRAILARDGPKELDLIEAEASALDCARQNVTDPRARFYWADATTHRPARLWDAVVMNPPFHIARAADPNLGLGFLNAAHRGLSPSGSVWLVANRQLPYIAHLKTQFKQVEDLGGDQTFRLIRASYPIRTR